MNLSILKHTKVVHNLSISTYFPPSCSSSSNRLNCGLFQFSSIIQHRNSNFLVILIVSKILLFLLFSVFAPLPIYHSFLSSCSEDGSFSLLSIVIYFVRYILLRQCYLVLDTEACIFYFSWHFLHNITNLLKLWSCLQLKGDDLKHNL